MRPGDLVQFKAGTFGLNPPQNAGLYLDRIKRKGDYYVVLFTIHGRKELSRQRVGQVLLHADLPPDTLKDDAALKSRLNQALRDAASGAGQAAKQAREQATDRDLWKALPDPAGDPLHVRDLAAAYFRTEAPTGEHVGAVREILRGCEPPGVGYFDRADGRGDTWTPLTRDAYAQVTREREGLSALRNKLVHAEEVEEDGRMRTQYVGVAPEDAGLGDDDRRRLDFARAVMHDFVLHDGYSRPWGLAGTPVHTIDGWRLHDTLRFLAHDWTGSRATTSSDIIEVLYAVGAWTPHDAIVAIAQRKVHASAGFAWDLDEHAAREAERAPAPSDADAAGRTDLRDQECYTIDPPDAKDFDDAVAVFPRPEGGWTLWVHIADVSHYVRPGGRLDQVARERATSLYLPTGVLPMLPPRLSDDLCSLRAGVDRLAMSAEIELDADAAVTGARFHESIIRVRANKSYDDVLADIDAGREPFAGMARLAAAMRRRRAGLDLETGEVRVKLTPEEIGHHVKFGNAATQMIEAFMVAANEAVARNLAAKEIPILFRCHPLPDRSGVRRFNGQMRTMELPIAIELPEADEDDASEGEEEGPSVLELLQKGGGLSLGGYLPQQAEAEEDETPAEEPPPPPLRGLAQLDPEERDAWLAPFRDATRTVRDVADPERRDVVLYKLLACLGRAFYTPQNLGHFGLGSADYCHFTSPIRRYPDLVVHRQLRALLRGETPPHRAEDLQAMADHVSEQGADADKIERTVTQVALLFADRAADRPWPRDGIVNGVTKGSAFVSLGHGLEARIHASDIPGGPWNVDEHDSRLFVGSRDRPEMARATTKGPWRQRYDEELEEIVREAVRLGDRLKVTSAGFDFVDGKVQARLVD